MTDNLTRIDRPDQTGRDRNDEDESADPVGDGHSDAELSAELPPVPGRSNPEPDAPDEEPLPPDADEPLPDDDKRRRSPGRDPVGHCG